MGVVDVSAQAFPRSAGPPNRAIGHVRAAPELRVGHVQSADSATAQASVQADAQPNAQAGDPSVAAPAATSSPAPNFAPPSAQHAESPAGGTGAAHSQGVHFAVGGNDVVQAGYGPQSGTNTAAAPAGVSNAGPAIAGGSTHVAPGGTGIIPTYVAAENNAILSDVAAIQSGHANLLGALNGGTSTGLGPEHPIGIFAV